MSYQSYTLADIPQDVFGKFEYTEPANPPQPCRTIEITPQIRAMDDAQRAAREVPSAWALKRFLSMDNLRAVRKVVAKRLPEKPRWIRPVRKVNYCAICLVDLKRRKEVTCKACAKASNKQPDRLCVDGCGRSITEKTMRDTCAWCNTNRIRRAAPRKTRLACVCGALLRNGPTQRADKLCHSCGNAVRRRARAAARKVAPTPCLRCGKALRNGTGRRADLHCSVCGGSKDRHTADAIYKASKRLAKPEAA